MIALGGYVPATLEDLADTLHQALQPLIADAVRDPRHQQVVVHSVEEGFQVEVDHPAVAGGNMGLNGRDG